MPDAGGLAVRGDVFFTPPGFVWVVSDPGYAVPLGDRVVLNQDCLVLGDRGLLVLNEVRVGEPVPIQLVKEERLDAYVASGRSDLGYSDSPAEDPTPGVGRSNILQARLGLTQMDAVATDAKLETDEARR